jgi:hypothetical protein
VKIEGLIAAGAIRSSDAVRDELKRKDDTTREWADAQAGLFLELDEDIQTAASAVLGAHPKMMGRGGGRNEADPFVVAVAIARNGIVVTQETLSKNIEKPRIPDVCQAMRVRCIPLVEVIRDQGWTF